MSDPYISIQTHTIDIPTSGKVQNLIDFTQRHIQVVDKTIGFPRELINPWKDQLQPPPLNEINHKKSL